MASVDGGSVEHQPVSKLEVGKVRGTLATRILAVALLSVLVAVSIAMVIALPLVRDASTSNARETLSRQADTLAALFGQEELHGPGPGGPGGPGNGDGDGDHRGHDLLDDVQVLVVQVGSVPVGPVSARDIALVTTGLNFSDARRSGSQNYFLEGRTVGLGEGIILYVPDTVASSSANVLLQRMGQALGLGLLLAAIIALIVARQTAKPLKAAAAAASRLAQGERDVVLEVHGAAEVADIAKGLNRLSEELAASEDRQREFLMSVSHELRTPMTAVKGYAEALADEMIEPDDVAQVGQTLIAEGARLDRLVTDLLDLSRSGAVDFRMSLQETDVAQVAIQAAESWRLRCSKEGLDFESEITTEPVMAVVDATRLRQVIDNLVENSVRVTPAGGRIRLRCAADEGVAKLQIEDSGPGLSDEDLEVAFEPAVLNSRYRHLRPVGTGLGLALVGRLTQRMGGSATAGHSPLGGASFSVEFPLTPAR